VGEGITSQCFAKKFLSTIVTVMEKSGVWTISSVTLGKAFLSLRPYFRLIYDKRARAYQRISSVLHGTLKVSDSYQVLANKGWQLSLGTCSPSFDHSGSEILHIASDYFYFDRVPQI
jgi:hypothetical protein